MTGRKGYVGRYLSLKLKVKNYFNSFFILKIQGAIEVSGTLGVRVKSNDIKGDHQLAKAANQFVTDAEVLKRREQTGLETLVVYAVNDEC